MVDATVTISERMTAIVASTKCLMEAVSRYTKAFDETGKRPRFGYEVPKNASKSAIKRDIVTLREQLSLLQKQVCE